MKTASLILARYTFNPTSWVSNFNSHGNYICPYVSRLIPNLVNLLLYHKLSFNLTFCDLNLFHCYKFM